VPIPQEAQPIGRLRAREIVIDRLREWIVYGILAPGEVIKDSDIAETLGVSRTPVREALLQLEREGLIESVPGRWTRVAPIDLSHAERLYPVLATLESLSARLAAQRSPQGIARIAEAQSEFREAVARYTASGDPADVQEIRQADDRFHGAILKAADNAYLSDVLTPLKVLARRFEHRFFGGAPTAGESLAEEHESLVAALRAGDADEAAWIAQHNWEKTLDYFRDVQSQQCRDQG
jgi:DNA-binding GntR family transcriptional regulator